MQHQCDGDQRKLVVRVRAQVFATDDLELQLVGENLSDDYMTTHVHIAFC